MEPFSKQQLADFLGTDTATLGQDDEADALASYLTTHGYEFVLNNDGTISAYRDGVQATADEVAELVAASRNERSF
ncbi:MAG TPA: hypothetical protein H9894_10390 [Candidatus Desulfovibrio intestinipullorum]|uniref:Uncharacterized protein n=1 Tax=Candidatus Desulfovibrio intestinipullorum TaxID=2838536 RepID=A0A9D1PZ48_9BACT|nr:hypothetical protein [Candidatus Desulfovibrio intestinipullorum]